MIEDLPKPPSWGGRGSVRLEGGGLTNKFEPRAGHNHGPQNNNMD